MLWKWRRSESVRGDRDGSKLEWIRRIRMRLEYDNALQQIDIFLSQAEIDEVRIAILDYAIKAIKRDLIGEGLAQIVYGKEVPEWRAAFPISSQHKSRKHISIDLSKTDILVTTWKEDRLSKAIQNLMAAPFDQGLDYYTATYYPEIELAIIGNGMHHTAVASVGASGVMDRCTVIHMTPAFDDVSTDGANWMNSKTGSIMGVDDFRFALLFTLAQMRNGLNGNGISNS